MKNNKGKKWKFHNPVKIYFGIGQLSSLPAIIGKAKTVLITTSGFSRRGIVDLLKKNLGSSLVGIFDEVKPNPTFASVKEVFRSLSSVDYDFILALGGGSTIDTAKAFAAIAAADNKDWLEFHSRKGVSYPEGFNPKPIIAVPTTAGSGSEVTMWATIWDMENKKKYSITHPLLYPKTAILDPELTLSLPEKETIYSAFDALSHAMESIWNKNNNPLSDALSVKAIKLIYNYLPALKIDLKNIGLRTFLLRASLFAGLAFSNTQTALAHSISYPLTAIFGIPHGLASSLPLPHLAVYNAKIFPELLKKISSAFNSCQSPEEVGNTLKNFFKQVGVSLHLSDYGVTHEDAELICKESLQSARSGNNIAEITERDLMAVIQAMI